MIEMRERFEDRFHVNSFDSPYMPADPFPEMAAGQGGGERKSDSNRQELRPKQRPRI